MPISLSSKSVLISLGVISVSALTACSGAETTSSSPATPIKAVEAVDVAESPSSAQTSQTSSVEQMRAVYGNILRKYTTNRNGINLIAYGSVTQDDKAKLKTYIASLEARGTEGLSRDEQMAFWYNLYNAKTIDVILDAYPLKSIRKLGALNSGPWDKKNMNVKGYGAMSLNDVEHETLRKNWKEPRIHYAVNCASIGCPNLKATPWTAQTLEADMQQAAIDYINHPRGFRVENGKVRASKIFDWYKQDFGGNKAGILAHARQYARGDLKTALDSASTINGFDYDWDLNEG